MPLVVDAHEDIAYNALTFPTRNYRLGVKAIREAERGTEVPSRNGTTTLGLPEWLAGRVAVVFATLFAAPTRRKVGDWDALSYATPAQAQALASAQLDYYYRLADEWPEVALISTRSDLERVVETWREGADESARRVGLIPLMEGADPIQEPEEAAEWFERGVRIIGPAWAGTRYSGGTGDPGPLTDEGRALLAVLSELGAILDLSHASEQSFFESLDRFEGVVIASHANPRALAEPKYPERALSDDQIRSLVERGGVIGVVPYNSFLKTGWTAGDPKVGLSIVAAAVDHICQIAGDAQHAGLGSDFDGGFGLEGIPEGLDSVADLVKIGQALKERGYSEGDVEAVMGGNWLAVLRRGLPQ